MPAFVMWLLRLVPWLLSSVVGDNVLRFAAGKVLLTTLFLVVLPLVLNNFMYDILSLCMSIVSDNTTAVAFNGTMSFSGLTAHLLAVMKVPDCMSVMVSALVVRATLNMIPFVRV
jgi:hypothetical protein